MHPDQLTSVRFERNNRSARSSSRVEDAINHQRRALQFVFGPSTQVVGLETPRYLELVEIVGVNLIERRIASAGQIAGVVWPIAIPGGRRPRAVNGCGGWSSLLCSTWSGTGIFSSLAQRAQRRPYQSRNKQHHCYRSK